MAGGLGGRPGGILTVVSWLRDAGTAAEYELYIHGFDPASLTGDCPDWHQAFVLLRHAPSTSPFKAKMLDWANEGIDVNSHLLAAINDNLQNLIYGLGNKKGPKPKPTDLTGEAKKRDTVSFHEEDGSPIQGVSVEEMKARLGITDI